MATDDTLFDTLLNLEEQYYLQGYNEGYRDGIASGKLEGHSLGFKTGFEKFSELGFLAGQATIWAQACGISGIISEPNLTPSSTSSPIEPPIASNSTAKLKMHIRDLYALVRPDSLHTENTDQAMIDLEDRLKRAQGKARVIESLLEQNKKHLLEMDGGDPS